MEVLLQGSNVFAGKHGLITPRDLFRWASTDCDGYQQLAEAGYMLLAERLRSASERLVVQQALQKTLNVQVCKWRGFESILHLPINDIYVMVGEGNVTPVHLNAAEA